jgi:hypothetical protein
MLVGIITDVGPKVGCPRSEVDPEESFSGTLVGASSVPSCLCGWEGVDPGFKSAKFTCSERKRRHWSLELHIRILQRAINFHPPSATALRQLQRSPAQATRDLSRLRSSCSFAAACAHLNSKNPNLAHQCLLLRGLQSVYPCRSTDREFFPFWHRNSNASGPAAVIGSLAVEHLSHVRASHLQFISYFLMHILWSTLPTMSRTI